MSPFWLDDASRPDTLPPLTENIDTDLLIVGGGFTGLWAAVQAKENDPGRDVVLIEAQSVAAGASGRPGAIVSTSIMHGLSNAKRIFPNDLEALEELGRENMVGFRDSLERYSIDAQDEWNGELTVAVNEAGLPVLQEELALHQQYGHDVTLLNTDETRAEINSPVFRGAVWNKKHSGTVHPARLAWGLKAAAIQLGVRVFEQTPLVGLTKNGAVVSASIAHCRIKANKVLLATNAFASGHRKIKRRVVAIRDRIIATEPLSDGQMESIGWKNRQGIYDTRVQLNYMRLTRDNRIIFGGKVGYYYGNNTDPVNDRRPETYEGLALVFKKTFPMLSDVCFTHAWSGPIALTTRMAVHFQRYYDNQVVWVGGYSGFGVSASRFGAQTGLKILDEVDAPELDLEFAKSLPAWIPPEPFRWIGAAISVHALATAEEKGGWRRRWLAMVKKLGFPL